MKARPRPLRTGPKAVRGSDAARRQAALLLEVWSGVRTALSASAAMGVAAPRFYQLEVRALQMMVSAMEPRQRGRQKTAESELAKLRQERNRLQRDVERFQSLYRTSQRSLGIVIGKPAEPEKNAAPGSKRRRGPRTKARGQSMATVLLGNAPPSGAEVVKDGEANQRSGSRGHDIGRIGSQEARAPDPADPHRADVHR